MPTNEPAEQQGDPELGDAGKRAIQAERDRADKAERALATAQTRLKAFEDAGINDPAAIQAEIDRLTTENTTLTSDLGTRDKEISRLNVGIDKGLPKSLISRLQGDDEEALTADADSLLAFVPTGTKPPVPKADPSQGPSSGPASSTPEQEFAGFLSNQLAR